MPCGGLYGAGGRLLIMDQDQLKTANSITYSTTSATNMPINIFLFLVRVFLIMVEVNTCGKHWPVTAG
ncbi:hypothetical protein N9O21_01870 [Rhodobacteraceae bacterium]|nr:hypothetical protein [Paracoccaceae bacterium]